MTSHIEQAFSLADRYLSPPPVLLVITGPSGVGKDSVIHAMKQEGLSFHFVVTTTSRGRRPDEVEGVDYCFVSRGEFERMVADGEMLEYALVYDQYKGVPRAQVREALASGLDVVMRLDVQGAQTVKRLVPDAVTVFLIPPSAEILRQRLTSRHTDSPEQIAQRLGTAATEMGIMDSFDYVVPNRQDALPATVSDIAAILQAERLRAGREAILL